MFRLRFLFVALLCIHNSRAQQIYMEQIPREKGIQAHDIYAVVEDKQHYLWFTSDGGVWRYDGREYKNFTTADGLPDNVVFHFFEDTHNRKWFSSYSGKLAYIQNNVVHSVLCNDTLAQIKRMEIPSAIYVDKNDIVYLSYFRSEEIIKINPPYTSAQVHIIKSGSLSEFFVVEVEPGGFVAGSLKSFTEAGSRKLAVEDLNNVISEVLVSEKFAGNHRISCNQQKDGSCFITADNVVFSYRGKRIEKLITLPYTILSVLHDGHENLWVSTIDGGVYLYRKMDSTYQNPEIYLKGKTVGKIIQDHENAYWITTLNDGVYYVPHVDVLLLNSSNGLADNISYVYADATSRNVFCIDGKGILFAIRDGKVIHSLSCNLVADKANFIKKVLPFGGNRFVFFGRNSFILDASSWKIDYLSLKAINAVQALDTNTIFASMQTQLLRLNAKSMECLEENDVQAKINSIFIHSDTVLWLGTERGLLIYNIPNRKSRNAPVRIDNRSIYAIQPVGDDKVMIVYKSDDVVEVDRSLTIIKRLPLSVEGYSIRQVSRDAYHNLWLSTNKGILKIDQQLKVEKIQEQHGLPSNIINAVAVDSVSTYAACDRGLIVFPRSKSFFNAVPPDLYLDGILVNNVLQKTDSTFHLSYEQNFIKVLFAPVTYRGEGDVLTCYKMAGVDIDWRTTKNTQVEYTTLPPGTYTLTIYSVNHDHVPSRKLSLLFVIAPPFWTTWWFIITAFVVLVILLTLFYKWRLSVMRGRAKEKAGLREQLGQMEMHALRSQMNPHFIFNAINSIQHYILTNETFLANKFLVKFSKLIRNVLEQSRQEWIPLSEEIETVRFYIEIEALRFDDSFNYTIITDDDIDVARLKIPSLILQPYVENAIWHGLLLKKGKKELQIRVHKVNTHLVIEIDDNGIGLEASQAYGRNKNKKKSLGLEITQNRLDLLSQSLGVPIVTRIIDKFNQDGTAAGTTVILKTPLINQP